LNIHFVPERVQLGDLCVLHVPTGKQYVDIMIYDEGLAVGNISGLPIH
jgi:hypothetical protein